MYTGGYALTSDNPGYDNFHIDLYFNIGEHNFDESKYIRWTSPARHRRHTIFSGKIGIRFYDRTTQSKRNGAILMVFNEGPVEMLKEISGRFSSKNLDYRITGLTAVNLYGYGLSTNCFDIAVESDEAVSIHIDVEKFHWQ